jgi:hypothetical protein
MVTKYQKPKTTRRRVRNPISTFRGGVNVPVDFVKFRPAEGGLVRFSVRNKLMPIGGNLLTEVRGEVISVFVPTQAIHALKHPAESMAGSTEFIRQELEDGTPLFDLEAEGAISKKARINPMSIGGTKKVCESLRLAYLAANNLLRQSMYVKATLVTSSETAILPALISQTALQRMNGVLDPEDRVDGMVDFNGSVTIGGDATLNANISLNDSRSYTGQTTRNAAGSTTTSGEHTSLGVMNDTSGAWDNTIDVSGLTGAIAGGGISLKDFYLAENMDKLTRAMRQIVDANPEHGEEMVTRWAHGLSVEGGKMPRVVYRKEFTFGGQVKEAMDGANLEKYDTNLQGGLDVSLPVPATELGGVLVTMVAVKPDEVMLSRPDPDFTDEWTLNNFVADEQKKWDPQPVTVRQMYSDCLQADETNIAFYEGLNHHKKTFIDYGFSRDIDTNEVANKSAVWQVEIPVSVTPDNVLYPTNLDHYPFRDSAGDVVHCNVMSNATIATNMIFGATPVEELAQIETDNIFEDA